MSRHHKEKKWREDFLLLVGFSSVCGQILWSVICESLSSMTTVTRHHLHVVVANMDYVTSIEQRIKIWINHSCENRCADWFEKCFKLPSPPPHPPKIQIFNHSILIMSESLLHLCCFGVFSLYGFFRGKTVQLFRTVCSTVILHQHKKGPKAARYIQGMSCST